MYTPIIPIGEEKLCLTRFLNLFNAFVAHSDIAYSTPQIIFHLKSTGGENFGVYQVPKLRDNNSLPPSGSDAIFFYGQDEFYYEIDVAGVKVMFDGGFKSLIVDKEQVFNEFMEFLMDYYPEFAQC